MKFREMIFHIGLHKTGSTSIQNWLLQHREILDTKCDLYYPSFAANHSFHMNSWFGSPMLLNHLNVLENACTPEEKKEANARRMREFMKEAEAASASRILISAEQLSVFDPESLSKLMDWAQPLAGSIRAIGFVRHPGDWVVSCMQQALKGKLQSDEAFLQKYRLDVIVAHLDRWRDAVGMDALQIRDFRMACESEGGLLSTFCSLAEISPELLQETGPLPRSNESLSAEGASVLSAINARPDVELKDGPGLNAFLRMVELCHHIEGQRFTIPETVLRKFLVESKDGAEKLKSGYGIDFDLENYDIPRHAPSTLTPETAESLATMIIQWTRKSSSVALFAAKAKVVALRDEKKALKAQLQRLRSEAESSLLLKVLKPLLKLERSIHKRMRGRDTVNPIQAQSEPSEPL